MKVSQMRSIAVEAYRTTIALGKWHGPKSYGNNWPDIVNESISTSTGMNVDPSYGYNGITLKVRPSAKQIRATDTFWDANALLCEEDRLQIQEYLKLKCHKNRTIGEFLERNEQKDHIYRRRIDSILQKLIGIYSETSKIPANFNVDVEGFSEEKEENTEPMPKSPTYWRQGRFTIDYTGPKFKTIRPRKKKSKKRRIKQ